MSRNLHIGEKHIPNPSRNPSFGDILVSRRDLLKAAFSSAALAALPGCAAQGTRPQISFTPIPNGRPRSATVAIRRRDGGIVGT